MSFSYAPESAFGLQAALAMSSEALKLFNDIPALVGYTSLALLLMNIGFVKSVCEFILKFSYEFFLVHILVIHTLFYFVKPQGVVYQCLLGFISLMLSLIAGYFYSMFVDRVIYRKKVSKTN